MMTTKADPRAPGLMWTNNEKAKVTSRTCVVGEREKLVLVPAAEEQREESSQQLELKEIGGSEAGGANLPRLVAAAITRRRQLRLTTSPPRAFLSPCLLAPGELESALRAACSDAG